ncbi:MAG: efflux RND transporter periplasmic adaptor subunit [Magnetococcales bacterium]|nr:efflux RND transporter periplasmic adaptor subunit [Magnetococcales bacterium]
MANILLVVAVRRGIRPSPWRSPASFLLGWLILPALLFPAVALTEPAPFNPEESGFQLSGVTKARRDVDLSVPVQGRITKIFFREGERVTKGSILLHLENQLEKLAVEQRTLLLKSRAELRGAMARERKLRKRLESTKKLFNESRSVSGEVVEQKELELLAAVTERKRLELIKASEAIELEVAKANLDRRFLRAPFDGVITKLYLDEGESVDANQPVVHLVDADSSFFVANLEERMGRRFQTGQKVVLSIRTGASRQKREGTVTFVSPVMDSASGLMEVKVLFDNQDGLFRPGVSGKMSWSSGVGGASNPDSNHAGSFK